MAALPFWIFHEIIPRAVELDILRRALRRLVTRNL